MPTFDMPDSQPAAGACVTVRYFASLRERLGEGDVLPWTPGLTLGEVRARLVAQGGAHAEALGPGRVLRGAVAQRMAAADAPVPAGAEVAFFPPVTGG